MTVEQVTYKKPAQVGETLIFKDPDNSGNISEVRSIVTSIRLPYSEEDEDFQEFSEAEKEELYNETIITIDGRIEALPKELYRKKVEKLEDWWYHIDTLKDIEMYTWNSLLNSTLAPSLTMQKNAC